MARTLLTVAILALWSAASAQTAAPVAIQTTKKATSSTTVKPAVRTTQRATTTTTSDWRTVVNQTNTTSTTVTTTSLGNTTTTTATSVTTTTATSTTTSTTNSSVILPSYTNFETKLTMENGTDFNVSDWVASIAASSNINPDAVVAKSVDFTVTVQYQFADDVTDEEVAPGVAAKTGVKEENIMVNISAVTRRLAYAASLRQLQAAARRLAVIADVTITTKNAELTADIKKAMNDTAALAEEISIHANRTIAAPTVTVAPALAVDIETEIVSMTGYAVTPPSDEDIATQMSQRSGVPVLAETQSADIDGNTTTTEEDYEEVQGGAAGLSTMWSTVFAAVISGMAVFV